MLIRPIEAGELDAFASLPGHDQRNASVRDYVARMIAAGAMRPEWCFVAEQDGRRVGNVAFWTLPGRGAPQDLVLLEAPWDEPDLATGLRLVCWMLAEARARGATEIGYVLDAPPLPPQWQESPDARAALLERVGFALSRETTRFEWLGNLTPASSGRLVYRDQDQVGETAFIDAIARVSEGTLDQEISAQRERRGIEPAARELLDLLRQLEHEPGWWHLAYAPAGELVGLVMPAKTPTVAVIGYVGVVPEQRGHGYVDDLLAQAATTLLAIGCDRIVADADRGNTPMAAALRRAGYVQVATRREYAIDLTQPPSR